MKYEYYMGRKNKRQNYWLYKKEYKPENPVNKTSWWKAVIKDDQFQHWVYCNVLPEDMHMVVKEVGDMWLFRFCL